MPVYSPSCWITEERCSYRFALGCNIRVSKWQNLHVWVNCPFKWGQICALFHPVLIKLLFHTADRLDDSDFTYIRNHPMSGKTLLSYIFTNSSCIELTITNLYFILLHSIPSKCSFPSYSPSLSLHIFLFTITHSDIYTLCNQQSRKLQWIKEKAPYRKRVTQLLTTRPHGNHSMPLGVI